MLFRESVRGKETLSLSFVYMCVPIYHLLFEWQLFFRCVAFLCVLTFYSTSLSVEKERGAGGEGWGVGKAERETLTSEELPQKEATQE